MNLDFKLIKLQGTTLITTGLILDLREVTWHGSDNDF